MRLIKIIDDRASEKFVFPTYIRPDKVQAVTVVDEGGVFLVGVHMVGFAVRLFGGTNEEAWTLADWVTKIVYVGEHWIDHRTSEAFPK